MFPIEELFQNAKLWFHKRSWTETFVLETSCKCPEQTSFLYSKFKTEYLLILEKYRSRQRVPSVVESIHRYLSLEEISHLLAG